MAIQQLNVFLENKTGRLNDVTKILAANQINMTAFSVADNSDFGILRVIVSNPELARTVLKAQGFAVSLTNVIGLHISNTAGTLNTVLDCMASGGVYIEYMYAFSEGEMASVIIKPDNMEKACSLLLQAGVPMM